MNSSILMWLAAYSGDLVGLPVRSRCLRKLLIYCAVLVPLPLCCILVVGLLLLGRLLVGLRV